MKARLSAILAVLGAAWLDSSAIAEDYTYTTNNGTITITKYLGSGGDVVIPGQINGLPVVTIRSNAFLDQTNVTSVLIPASVTSLETAAFRGCTSLSAINVATLNSVYSSLGGVVFNKMQTTLIQFPKGKSGAYAVPNGVTNIGSAAFSSCTELSDIALPGSLQTINGDAFYWCLKLARLTIPAGVSNIPPWTFAFARSLTNLTFLGSVTNIGDWAFHECCVSALHLPDGLVSIGIRAFSSSFYLTNLVIGRRIATLGEGAFAGSSNLKGVYFRGDAPSFGTNVFQYDNQATVYYLPETGGWGASFAGRPTAIWFPAIMAPGTGFGPQTNHFGFHLFWAGGKTIVIEAGNLSAWAPLRTNTLTGDFAQFVDPDWKSQSARFYRVRQP
jgi:hypothetical protein